MIEQIKTTRYALYKTETINSSKGVLISYNETSCNNIQWSLIYTKVRGCPEKPQNYCSWKSDKIQMSSGFLKATFGRRILLLLLISCFRKKIGSVVSFKCLG